MMGLMSRIASLASIPAYCRQCAAMVLLVTLTGLVALPSANYLTFAGIPFNSLPQYLLLVALLPVVAWPWLRRRWSAAVLGWPALWIGVAIVAVVGGSLVKGALLVGGEYEGFAGCYRALYRHADNYRPRADDRRIGSCEKAWENPLARFHATRVDPVIDFGPDDWNLSFVNDRRFNFYNWRGGSIPRDRLPFSAYWRGVVSTFESRNLTLTYVGRVRIWLAMQPLSFPTSHGATRTVEFRLPAGQHGIVIEYTFDDGSRTGSPPAPGPTLRLMEQAPDSVEPLRPRAAPLVLRLAGGAVDTLLLAASLLLALFWLSIVRAEWKPLLATAVTAGAVYCAAGGIQVMGIDVLMASALFIPGILVLVRPQPAGLAAAYWCVATLMLAHEASTAASLEAVLVRRGGSDFLTYESFSRTILETWSLEGGEEVFFYQPFFRYVLFVERVILGDGDVLLPASVRSALVMSILYMAWTFRARGRWNVVLSTSSVALLLAFVNTAEIASLVRRGASEYPTWIAFFVWFAILFRIGGGRTMLAACLVGLSFITRINQAPGLLWLFGIRAWYALHAKQRDFLVAVGLLAAITLLPAVHNYVYGGRVVWGTTSAAIPENLRIHPARYLEFWQDEALRAEVAEQLIGMLYAGPFAEQGSFGPWWTYRGLQLLWLMALCTVVYRRAGFVCERCDLSQAMVLMSPVAFLVLHLFWHVDVYYPRHIVMGHIAMGASALYVCSRRRHTN